ERRSRMSGHLLQAFDAAPDARINLPGDRSSLRGQLVRGNVVVHQNGFVSGGAFVERRHVSQDLIHRDATEHRTSLAVDDDIRAAIGQMALISIRIANRERCDSHRFGRDKSPAVADPATRIDITHEGYSRLPGESSAQPGLKRWNGRAAVHSQTQANEIAGELGKYDTAGAVAHVNLCVRQSFLLLKRARDAVKKLELGSGKGLVFVRDGKMRGNPGYFDSMEGAHFPDGRDRISMPDAHAPHARIDLQVYRG